MRFFYLHLAIHFIYASIRLCSFRPPSVVVFSADSVLLDR